MLTFKLKSTLSKFKLRLSKSKHKSAFTDFYSNDELNTARQFFDPKFYLTAYPDVARLGVDPFTHYITYGWKERRLPAQNLTPDEIDNYSKSTNQTKCPLIAYSIKMQDKLENFSSGNNSDNHAKPVASQDSIHAILGLLGILGVFSKLNNLAASKTLENFLIPLFSAHKFRQNQSLSESVSPATCLTRYLANDLECGIAPSNIFNASFYKSQLIERKINIDEASFNPILHWLEIGVKNQISPTPLYVNSSYLSLNPDLINYPNWAFEHFIKHGISEGRQFLPTAHICSSQIFDLNTRYRSASDYCLQNYSAQIGSDFPFSLSENFYESDEFDELFRNVNNFEPEIGSPKNYVFHATAPFHDAAFLEFRCIIDLLPKDINFDIAIFVPFCKLGGADYVAGVLSQALNNGGKKIIIIRTDQSDWERADWFPPLVHTVDLSAHLAALPVATCTRILYEIIRFLKVSNVFNVNSLRFFQAIERFGKQMTYFTQLHCYYFCADRDAYGYDAGYPVAYFTNIFAYLKTAITDNKNLADELINRYQIPLSQRMKIVPVFTPTSITPLLPIMGKYINFNFADITVYWGGRLDRQKRFDLVIEIAKRMPLAKFHCWGKAVLDKELVIDNLPSNLILNPPFHNLDDLPLSAATAWLYTSEWDGLPTILLECAARALPIVASKVGGVGELIDDSTGWPVTDWDNPQAYVDAIYAVAADPTERDRRRHAMYDRLKEIHASSKYELCIYKIIGEQHERI